MKAKKMIVIFCLILFSSTALNAFNIEEPQSQKRTRENINTLRLIWMTRVLDLTEEQAAKIFPALNRIEKEKMRIQRQITSQMKELRTILKGENPDLKEVEEKVVSLMELRNMIKNKDEEFESCLEDNLTLIQRAKYLALSGDFYRRLRENLEKARKLYEKYRQKARKK